MSMSQTKENEAQYRAAIRAHMHSVLGDCVIPELGPVKKGKVRDIYFSGENVIMVASDRVSAFDYILPNLIPYKGQVLNTIAKFAFDNTADVVPNALVGDFVDHNVVVQKRLKNCGVECVVRGYLWGSMGAAYEKGDRTFCGLRIPDGLYRFCKFDTPLFTPTTKAELGAHDENITMEDVSALIGKDLAEKVKSMSLKLYQRGAELAAKQGLVFIDTKYEFGTDEHGEVFVIDEINTPDSSRLCDVAEWGEKWPMIEAEMKTGQYKNVTELISKKPELKITEYSKQYVRDVLLEQGFQPGKALPVLNDDQVVEVTYRYIRVCERITGRPFEFAATGAFTVGQRLMTNLQRTGLAKGACAILLAGSDPDLSPLKTLQESFAKFGIPTHYRICSAHKEPARLQEIINYYNRSVEPLIIVACVRGTDAISGTVAFHSYFPVVSCPPDGINHTCLTNPSGCSNAFITSPENVAKFACQMFSLTNPKFREALQNDCDANISSLVKADLATGYCP